MTTAGKIRTNFFQLRKLRESFMRQRLEHIFKRRTLRLARSPIFSKDLGRACEFAFCLLVLSILLLDYTYAEPSLIGQSGLINMPDGRLLEDGISQTGASYLEPYSSLWAKTTVTPFLELSGRVTRTSGLSSASSTNSADRTDRALDLKTMILPESRYRPQITVGVQDLTGSRDFRASYLALSKTFGNFDLTLGYGQGRIDDFFGGVRYRPSLSDRLSFLIEYDANNYKKDPGADLSGAVDRKGGLTPAIEFRYRWLGVQLALQGQELGFNTYITIPLDRQELRKKVGEPPPYTESSGQRSTEISAPRTARSKYFPDTLPTRRQRPSPSSPPSTPGELMQCKKVVPMDVTNASDCSALIELAQELEFQGYQDLRLSVKGSVLEARFSHPSIARTGRAIGRAARTMVLIGSESIETLRLTITENSLPILSYRIDAHKLRRYLKGWISEAQLRENTELEFGNFDEYFEASLFESLKSESNVGPTTSSVADGFEYSDDYSPFLELGDFSFAPVNLGEYVTDSSGEFRYELFSRATYELPLGHGLYFNAAARFRLLDTFDNVSQPSNSLLPHVRSDVADYKQGNRLKLESLLLNKFLHPQKRVYVRFSGGFYEEMYAGLGGQILYLPEDRRWAFDLSSDLLRQRDADGAFGFRDYSTATILGSFHWRVPKYGLTTTVRAGRFLARDHGFRLELKRRFRSGLEFGLWYTITDGDDITIPGSRGNPYHDKGLMLSIPLNIFQSKDSRTRSEVVIRPYTRDVGQMVSVPNDLFLMMERHLSLDLYEIDPMTDFGL